PPLLGPQLFRSQRGRYGEDNIGLYQQIQVLKGGMAMKRTLAMALAAFSLIAGFLTAGTEKANAVVYCQYISYPAGCVVRPGVVLAPRPVARAAAREAVRPGTPMNRGGPVNRIGRY